MPTLTAATFGKFCREIALGLDEESTLLREWEVEPDHWQRIKTSEAFAQEMVAIRREVQEQGADAGYIFRMKSLSESMIPHIIKMMDDVTVAPSIKVDLIKFCAEIGRLRPQKEAAPAGGPTGPMVTFNFGPGLPIKTIEVAREAIQPHVVDLLPAARGVERDGDDLPSLDGFPS